MTSIKQRQHNTSNHLIAGAISGMINCIALQPLDLVKTRMQSGEVAGKRSIMNITRSIVNSGSVLSLWKGTVPTILRNTPGSSLYFGTLNASKRLLDPIVGASNQAMINLLAGSFARVSVGFLLMPFTVIKSRYESSMYNYKSLGDAFSSIWRTDGIRGFFYGFGSTALRDAPYSGIYVLIYEHLKKPLSSLEMFQLNGESRNAFINMTAAVNAGILATAATQPFDVLRVRIQLSPNKYKNMFAAAKSLLLNEGYRVFFSGVVPRLIRKTLSAAITWTILYVLYGDLVGDALMMLDSPNSVKRLIYAVTDLFQVHWRPNMSLQSIFKVLWV
ncbi:hypothetical protein MP228_010133 [Amoeboaphelidium protococcarum]|nr:hypothetical protein MP228_010133 [Amoeboaphelidium protococcarum]